MAGCRGAGERATRALRLIVEEARGASGYLFLMHQGELVLAAPTVGVEPPPELALALAAAIDRESSTVVDRPSSVREAVPPGWKPIVLSLELTHGGARVVGAAAVMPGAVPLADLSPELIAEIARELYDAGDVSAAR
jgi:hypothetical protein